MNYLRKSKLRAISKRQLLHKALLDKILKPIVEYWVNSKGITAFAV